VRGAESATWARMPNSQKKLKELDELIEGIETAMLTTRRPDGHLVSRPMATQGRISDADLWFVTSTETHKDDEIKFDPNVNCSYYNMKTREWVSVSGVARISKDRHLIKKLYKPDWKIWFGDEGGKKDGGPNDPRLALIFVDIDSVTYMKNDKPRPVILWEIIKARVTGKPAEIGDTREITGAELMD
jgi:general stress protein 26